MTLQSKKSNTNHRLISPLRYPGSKRRLVSLIEEALKINHLRPEFYVEPFVGGGSVALHLLQHQMVDKIILIDRDPWVASFWQTVFFDTDWLLDQIENIPITLENWHSFKHSNPEETREQALTCLFLNRTSFSGILEKHVGPLGGKNQTSPYKIDCRFPRANLLKRIQEIAFYKDQIYAVWNLDWKDAINQIQKELEQGKISSQSIFYYLDPPFFEAADKLYRFYFDQAEHKALRDFLEKLQSPWILSYDFTEQVNELYGQIIETGSNGTKKQHVEFLYTLATLSSRRKGQEVLISNLEKLPEPNITTSTRDKKEN
jgi:DNA adenine methylase